MFVDTQGITNRTILMPLSVMNQVVQFSFQGCGEVTLLSLLFFAATKLSIAKRSAFMHINLGTDNSSLTSD